MMDDTSKSPAGNQPDADSAEAGLPANENPRRQDIVPAKEIGGREGPDPTRYGDWEKAGRCIDF